jgi:hypothetical protein
MHFYMYTIGALRLIACTQHTHIVLAVMLITVSMVLIDRHMLVYAVVSYLLRLRQDRVCRCLLYALLAPSLPPAIVETITLLLVELLTGGARLSALSSAYTPNTSYTAAGDSSGNGSSSVPMSPATTAAASPGVGGGTSGGGWEVGLSEDLQAVLYMLVSTLSKQVRPFVVVPTRTL